MYPLKMEIKRTYTIIIGHVETFLTSSVKMFHATQPLDWTDTPVKLLQADGVC